MKKLAGIFSIALALCITITTTRPAHGMEPFIGEIAMFAGNFAPRGWAFCDGQLLAINQYQALFSLLGTTYGGDGRTTFGLPDLRGRTPIHAGSGPGLSPRALGSRGGQEDVTLSTAQIPAHNHVIQNHPARATSQNANTNNPIGSVLAGTGRAMIYNNSPGAADGDMAAGSGGDNGQTGNSGGNQPHANMPPYQSINYIIALVGIYPSRN